MAIARIAEGFSPSRIERRFYGTERAFDRFGMRIFTPQLMPEEHWHGHVEFNFLIGASMTYHLDGREVVVPERRLATFWAGLPHRLTSLHPNGNGPVTLANLYMPVDAFLALPHIIPLQMNLMSGDLVLLPDTVAGDEIMERWYGDYRSRCDERFEILKMELNALLRRGIAGGLTYVGDQPRAADRRSSVAAAQVEHIVAMVRYILENLSEPMTNADVAAVTGMHPNYAVSLFKRMMRTPIRRFIIRMRLIRARSLVVGSNMPIGVLAEDAGFSSASQFYKHFMGAYGVTPRAMRERIGRPGSSAPAQFVP